MKKMWDFFTITFFILAALDVASGWFGSALINLGIGTFLINATSK